MTHKRLCTGGIAICPISRSVQVVLDNGKGFFPDFVIGIDGRKCEDGGLLADPKFTFEIAQEQPKAHARHPVTAALQFLVFKGVRIGSSCGTTSGNNELFLIMIFGLLTPQVIDY